MTSLLVLLIRVMFYIIVMITQLKLVSQYNQFLDERGKYFGNYLGFGLVLLRFET